MRFSSFYICVYIIQCSKSVLNVKTVLISRLFIAHQSEERLSNKNKLNSISDVHPLNNFVDC